MNITEVSNDSAIWKKKINNPEVVELIDKMKTWENGKTFEVTLEKPFKPLKGILRKEFKETSKISVIPKDETKAAWFIRVDTKAARN